MDILLEPFAYDYMLRAMAGSAIVGAACAFLSCYLILKGWSLMGDALAHSVVPGVAIAYLAGFPYAIGAFISGAMAALGMNFAKKKTKLREDVIIGLVFTGFFAAGLLLVSINPTAVNVQSIILGNILAISNADIVQVALISCLSLLILALKWKDLAVVFFDESHARVIGLRAGFLKIIFFTLLSACTVAALQTVGACLVIAMVITPGATAYLMTDRFGVMIILSVLISVAACIIGAYLSYFLNGATGGVIVILQTVIFLCAWLFSPIHGVFKRRPGFFLQAEGRG